MKDDILRHIPAVPVAWKDVPSSVLQAELARRRGDEVERPQCGSGDSRTTYNTPLHVFALFLILILSTLACSVPIIVRRFPRLPVPHHALFLSRHFGTGVLIATAFVHLLPTAFVSLTDPCLPPFWNEGYPAMAGLIAMVSVMVVVGVEMFFAMKGAAHSHAIDYSAMSGGESAGDGRGAGQNGHSRPPMRKRFTQDSLGVGGSADEENGQAMNDSQHGLVARNGSNGYIDDEDGNSDLDLDELDPQTDETRLFDGQSDNVETRGGADDGTPNDGHKHTHHLSEHQQQQKMLLQCLLLEAGILFHSIFIGMAVSVATGTPFIVLLIAISFHQTFEGLALGSRISAITAFPRGSPKPWLMALAYGTTTPIGQAIGLLVHNLYDPYSQTGLLMVGVMNAISSGLLLFAGLVELVAEDFLSDHSYESLQGKRRLQACAAVVGGSMLMALVGAWA